MTTCPKLFFVIAVLLATLTIGCGGGGSASNASNSIPAGTPTTSVHVMLGDAPSDRLLSFEITVNTVTLMGPSGSVSVLSSPTRIELTHLSGTSEPLVLRSIPQGTYTQATLTFSSPEATILDSKGNVVEKTPALTTNTATITFNPSLVVGGAPVILSFDFDVAASVTIDANDNVSVTPTLTASTSNVAASDDQNPENGELEDISGTVTAVSGTTFTISVSTLSQSLTFNTDGNTEFKEGLTGISSLANGMLVEVEGSTLSDGTLYAKEVSADVEAETGMEAEGWVVSTTGNPVTQFDLVVNDVSSSGSTPVSVGSTVTVDISGGTKFVVDSSLDFSGLPFTPQFDASHLVVGQKVEADTDTPGVVPIPADKVRLKSTALVGTVSNLSTAGSISSFTLTVANDSAFAILTGKTSLTVYRVAGTELHDITSIANGDAIRVRGPLFFDGSNLQLVAARITNP